MSDETTQHGGARRKAGRPKGSKNRISKSAEAQARFAALIEPHLEVYFKELHSTATNRRNAPKDRLAAIKELLDRGMGRPAEIVDVINHDAEELTINDLLDGDDVDDQESPSDVRQKPPEAQSA